MSWRFAVASLLSLILVACCRPSRTAAQEIDKKPIVEQWRKEIQPLKEAYANCQVKGTKWWDKGFDGDGLELHSAFSYLRRGTLKRLDILNANLKMRLNESWVIGKTEAYKIQRNEEDQPYKLYRRSSEDKVKEYEKYRILTPYTRIRGDIVAAAPVSIPVFGVEAPDFIARDTVKLLSDERPDTNHPRWRKLTGTNEHQAGKPAYDFWIIVDEGHHWAMIEFSWQATEVRRTYKFHYSDDGTDIPKLTRIETYADVKGGRSGQSGEYRIEKLALEAPTEREFTVAAFGIPEDSEAEVDKEAKKESEK